MEKGRVREGGDKGSQNRGGAFSAHSTPVSARSTPVSAHSTPVSAHSTLSIPFPGLSDPHPMTPTFQPPRPSPHKLSSSHRFNSNSNATQTEHQCINSRHTSTRLQHEMVQHISLVRYVPQKKHQLKQTHKPGGMRKAIVHSSCALVLLVSALVCKCRAIVHLSYLYVL